MTFSNTEKLAKIVGVFAFGADPDEDINIKDVPKRNAQGQFVASGGDDDDDDDDLDDFVGNDPKDRKIAKVSRQSARRRIENKNLKAQLEAKDQEIAELRAELAKVPKLQKKLEQVQQEKDGQLSTVKKMAIRSAIEKATTEDGKALKWYDVGMVEALLDKETLSVDLNDFSVGGLTEQLSSIAESKPFLVKSSEDSGTKEQQSPSRRQPSGSAPQSSATGTGPQQEGHSEAELREKFPALGQF